MSGFHIANELSARSVSECFPGHLGRSTMSRPRVVAAKPSRHSSSVKRHGPGLRLIHVRELLASGASVSVYDLAAHFRMSIRNAARYLDALRESGEQLQEEWKGKRKVFRFGATSTKSAPLAHPALSVTTVTEAADTPVRLRV